MKRQPQSDEERWRSEFEGKGQTPIFWQIQARSLLCAANVLRERAVAIAGNRAYEPPEIDDPPNLRLMPVFLLYGYTLENLIKGLLVARGADATWSGSLNRDIRHHCLTELFRTAAVRTTSEDRRLLEDLRDAIESEKYPVGTRPRTRECRLGVNPDVLFKRVCGLFSCIENSLRHICLDGVLAPCDPERLGLPWLQRSVEGRPE
jgi:hypothetical protein